MRKMRNRTKRFTVDWTSSMTESWERLIDEHLKNKNKIQFLEIGCLEGRSTLWFWENYVEPSGGKLVACDPFDYNPEMLSRFLRNCREELLDKNFIWERKFSHDYLMERHLTRQPKLDLIYMDGCKDTISVVKDVLLCIDELKSGGVLIVDDYNWIKENETIVKNGVDIAFKLLGDTVYNVQPFNKRQYNIVKK